MTALPSAEGLLFSQRQAGAVLSLQFDVQEIERAFEEPYNPIAPAEVRHRQQHSRASALLQG